MKWRTAISVHKNGELYLHGKPLKKLIVSLTFSEAFYFVLRGRLPKKREAAMLDAILVSMIEHGVEAPSAFVARSVVSTGNPVNAALAAGILAIGEWHGGAIEKCAYHLQSDKNPQEIVAAAVQKKERLAGFGHKIYKKKDPRAELLFAIAKRLKFYGKFAEKAVAMEKELAIQTGKRLPINIDGAVAALISELGFDWRTGKAFFVFGRLPGLIAHTQEELVNEKPYRRLEPKDIEYIGV